MPISDRAKIGLMAFIRRVVGNDILGARVDYLAMYPSVVVKQNADGSLELQPDDARLPGYSNVPVRYGVPGITATVSPGARALLTFAGADPQKRIVVGWEAGTVLGIKLGSGATHPLIFGDDFSSPGGAFDTLMQAIAAAVGTSGSPAGATAAAATIVTAIAAYQVAVAAKLSTITKTA